MPEMTIEMTPGWEDDQSFRRHFEDLGQAMTRTAKRYAPVDTGELRDSIDWLIDIVHGGGPVDYGFELVVGAGAEHAPYVELGTRFMAAQPYLRRSLDFHGGRP